MNRDEYVNKLKTQLDEWNAEAMNCGKSGNFRPSRRWSGRDWDRRHKSYYLA